MQEAIAGFRLSPQQERLWLEARTAPTGRTALRISIDGTVDVERLRRALEQVVARHEILRTTFEHSSGIRVPVQVVGDAPAFAWSVIESIDDLESHAADRAVDFAAGPVVSATLAGSGDAHVLVIAVPSVCADAESMSVVLEDLVRAYRGAEDQGQPLQYADFAEWQHELLGSEDDDAAAAREFWSTRVGRHTPALPLLLVATDDEARPEVVDIAVSNDLRDAVDAVAKRYDVDAATVAQAAWHVVLARLTGEEDIAVATVPTGRRHAELETAVGTFAGVLPIAIKVGRETTFAEIVDRLGRELADAGDFADYVPPAAMKDLRVGFLATTITSPEARDDVAFTADDVAVPVDALAVALVWSSVNGNVRARLAYEPAALPAEQASRIADSFAELLGDAAAHPDAPVGGLTLVGAAERTWLTDAVNDTARPVPAKTVPAMIAASAVATPEAVAVVDEQGSLTYAELEARANGLANRLRSAGVGPDVVVGLCTDRSTDMVVGLLGILKAGAAYLPLHYEHPPARLAHQLSETEAPVLVTQSAILDHLPTFEGELICVDRDAEQLAAAGSDAPELTVGPDDLVYVIYTSGSTGTPKGVAVTQRNVVNYVDDIARRLGADSEPLAFGMVTAISTDLGNTAVFPALCTGGTLILTPPAVAADPAALAAWFASHPVDVLKITPSHLNALLGGAKLDAILPRRWLVLGGEALSWDLVAQVRAAASCQILNHYGPTETTIGSCTNLVPETAGEFAPSTVPVGAPIANTRCYVVEPNGGPAPVGTAGELLIGGAGVARGYVKQPEATAERFRTDPFVADADARIYATGDLARLLPDGTIEFLGRRDEQVKIRGFRVEPAEVESALRSHEAIREAVVVNKPTDGGAVRLVAYVVADAAPAPEDLRMHVGQWVPEFMVPAAFVTLESLPRTASGKVDRLALPEPDAAATGPVTPYVPPSTPVEEVVAALWADVLGVPRVGIDDDFFALGGHSLLATQIVAKLCSEFSIDLPLHSLFSTPTVRGLSATVVELAGGGDDPETAELLAKLEGLSDEEAERLLAAELDEEAPA
jgi:amino acid adenylation domain-containing protein